MELENLPIKRKASNAAALQEVQDGVSKSSIQFNQSIRRLAALNAQAPSELAPGLDEPEPSILISRTARDSTGKSVTIEATWDTPVLPGDIIRIPYPGTPTRGPFDRGLPGRITTTQN